MPFEVNEVVRRNEYYPGCDVTLPQCKSCRVRYDIYECGCYDMTCTDFKHMNSCKTCRPRDLYKTIEKGPEPTTIPKIEAKFMDPIRPCEEEVCVNSVELPLCRSEPPCGTEINVYDCAHILVKGYGSCRGCFPPEDSKSVPTTRPELLLTLKSENAVEYHLCDHCRDRKKRRDKRREKFQQEVEKQRVKQEARQRQADDTQHIIGEDTKRWVQESRRLQSQYHDPPDLRYHPSSTRIYGRPRVEVPLQEPAPRAHSYRSQDYAQGYVPQQADLQYAPAPVMPSTWEARKPVIPQADPRRHTEWQQNQEQRQREDRARFNAEEKRAVDEAAKFERSLPRENARSKGRSSRPSTSKPASKSSCKTKSRKEDGQRRWRCF
ncbi:hypothetical protein OCU04_006773 [Sclerotinia nivalis]|uniref:Uncharacterized protein n=1 Tax=Sclerotinia nivalis TaxID=352851 RepID=A0A9X0ALD2_9HELO|nr:hypothetical protein OCU04_006773 [Sclerotinia nivalis]